MKITKYDNIKKYVIDCIEKGIYRKGEKIPSENELMEKFDVSRHTVRKSFDDLTNEGWLYKMQGKGTFVSPGKPDFYKTSKLVGVVTTYLRDYIFPEIISGIEEVFTGKGYSIIVGNTNNQIEKERISLENLLSNDIKGLILETTKSAFANPNGDIIEKFANRNIPVLFIHGYYREVQNPSYIVVDDMYGGYIAAKHLLELGHRNIGGVFKSDDMQGHNRYQGFMKAHREMGVPIKEDAVLWFMTEDRGLFFEDEKYKEALYEKLKNCTGLVIYNDQISMGVIDVFRNRGVKIPDDISIVSFDDSKIADTTDVKLTSVIHPKAELGIKAAEEMEKMINDRSYRVTETLRPELAVRNSTRKL